MVSAVLDFTPSNHSANFSYFAYGLNLQSDTQIPDLPKAPQSADPDVQVFLIPGSVRREPSESEIIYSSDIKDESGQQNLIVSKETISGDFHLLYRDGIEFTIENSGTRVNASWPGSMTLEDTVTYLLGPVLGLVLRLKGTVSLHASSVAVENKAIAFLGCQGAGKSTLAAAFAILGYPVLSDDVSVLTERNAGSFLVQPAYPRIRLWPESVPQLYADELELPFLTPNWDKRYLQLGSSAYKFQSKPLPLGAIYVLEGTERVADSPMIKRLDNGEALLRLVSNSYVNYLLDKIMRGREFEVLKRVVDNVPVCSVSSPKRDRHPVQLCEAILEDFHSVGDSALP